MSSGPGSAGGWRMGTVQFITGCLCCSFLTLFCSSTGHFSRVQSFRNRMIQCGFPVESQVLPANLYQYEFPMRSQPSLGIHLLQQRVFHGLRVDLCSPVDLYRLQGDRCLTMLCTTEATPVVPTWPNPCHINTVH